MQHRDSETGAVAPLLGMVHAQHRFFRQITIMEVPGVGAGGLRRRLGPGLERQDPRLLPH